ncbi:MAG: ribosomal-processing cysteine protease Prp [Clostridia bacterium]
MTTVVFYRTGRGRVAGFDAVGHAGFAEAGEDIVCAGVSALTQTAVNALERVAGIQPWVRIAPGLLCVRLTDEGAPVARHDAQVILRTMHQGIRDMTAAYPAYVRVLWKERRCSKCFK